MEIYRFTRPDGTLDYERYRSIQTAGNSRKIDQVWVSERNVSFLSEYLTKTLCFRPKFGICHGTRRGNEQLWFRKYLRCNVIGTEISDTATQFPYTIQWDFHEPKPEWLESADFIYSNSLDHSYDPEKCLSTWMSCIRPSGVCIIEHTSSHERASLLDPFGAKISEMPYLILKWGKGQFYVREILEAPDKPDFVQYVSYLVIRRSQET